MGLCSYSLPKTSRQLPVLAERIKADFASFDYFSITFFQLCVNKKNRRGESRVQTGTPAVQECIKTHVAPITIVVARHDALLALGHKPGGRVWRYRECDFCRQPLRWPRN